MFSPTPLNATVAQEILRGSLAKAVRVVMVVTFFALFCLSCLGPSLANEHRGTQSPGTGSRIATSDAAAIGRAFKGRRSNVQVAGEGTVTRLLPDDLNGSRHQRFIVRLASGQTLLVTHNIDIAPRIVGLKKGDRVRFNGEYVWNKQGGVIHWTHHDPEGRHVTGWVNHNGKTYK